jgi:hypothetical protein
VGLMPTLPDVDLRIQDGALGLLPEASDRVQLVLATAADGPANVVTAIGTKDVKTFKGGPLVECVALKLDAGVTVLALRVPTTTKGVVGEMKAPQDAPPVSATGEPLDGGGLVVRITVAGERTKARFVWSIDDGATFSVETNLAASVPLGNTGITLEFPEGEYGESTRYAAPISPPTYSADDLVKAFDAAFAAPREWGLVHVVGLPAPSAPDARAKDAVALANTVAARMTAAETHYRYARAVVEAPALDDAVLVAAYANFVSTRVAVVARRGRLTSSLDGTRRWRSLAWAVTLPLGRKALGKDPAQVRSEPGTGPLPAVLTDVDADESATPNLDNQRFVTVRTYVGKRGFFVTNFPLMSGPRSDFKYLHLGQIVDTACKVARAVLLDFLSADLELNAKGNLSEPQAQAIEQALEDALRAALIQPGHANAVFARANRTDDVLATETLRGSFRIQPKFYPKHIEFDVGFTKIIPAES